MTFSERTDEGVLPVITEDLIFLAGSLCMILAVWAGQSRGAHPT